MGIINTLSKIYLKLRWLNFNFKKYMKCKNTNFAFHKNIYIKWNIFINSFCSILAWKKSKITFLWDCLIWPWTVITSTNHSTNIKHNLFEQIRDEKDVIIWNEVWIWANVTILPWVEIAKWCIIWAWAVVTKSIEQEYSIVWWVPAKIIRKRN